MLEKLKSRKLFATLLAAVMPIILSHMGFSGPDLWAMLAATDGPLATYVMAQGHVDASAAKAGV